jgi:hypothetical protein
MDEVPPDKPGRPSATASSREGCAQFLTEDVDEVRCFAVTQQFVR